MKEAPSSKKMPRKPPVPPASGTPTKATNDEILSTLLRLNNFDSSIKDESLDIDLSACVTISADSAALIGANSLSSTDFWRVLDESAQTVQLDLTTSSNDALEDGIVNNKSTNNSIHTEGDGTSGGTTIIKLEQLNSFSGTFLRPEMPAPSISPLKRSIMRPHSIVEQPQPQQQNKLKNGENKNLKLPQVVKQEPAESLPLLTSSLNDDAAFDGVGMVCNSLSVTSDTVDTTTDSGVVSKTISSPSFSIFMLTGGASTSNTACAVTPPSTHELPEKPTNPPEPIFKCLDCNGLLLSGQQEYSSHESIGHRIHHRCVACERDFEQESALKKHLKTHRSLDARKDAWKKCPDCGKCLKLGSMWMHRKIHSDNKKYGCDICGQKFVQKINLTHHSRVHTAEKPYECPECQKRFQERSHLQRHQKYHAQTRSYRCEKCGKMYKTERCLKVHNLVHLEQRPFACNVCDKSFISNSKLKQHSNIHTGERPFKCNYCPRDFTNFPNWLKHTRRRHKVDHKTGEHLENIPSYCSKKSSKVAKQQKVTQNNTENSDIEKLAGISITQQKDESPMMSSTGLEVITNTITVTNMPATAVPKSQQTKRKKKVSSVRPEPPIITTTDNVILTTTQTANIIATLTMPFITTSAITATTNSLSAPVCSAPMPSSAVISSKAPKAKRERKQLSPKQVQKQLPTPPLHPLSIKREIVEPKATTTADTKLLIGNFPDLSITSAEELIMEQALEMEECGLYVTPPASAVDTDNAMSSSEAATALHFKIKNEFSVDHPRIKEEEYVSLRDINQRLLCSSLESSPFSSPASNELGTCSTVTGPMNASMTLSTNSTTTSAPTSTHTAYFMPSFTLNSHGTLVTSLNGTLPSISSSETVAPLQQQLFSHSELAQTTQMSSTQAIINHFYLHPMPMSMPLLVQPTNQVLPSVDTLLFSAATSGNGNSNGFFHNKSSPPTTQQKLS